MYFQQLSFSRMARPIHKALNFVTGTEHILIKLVEYHVENNLDNA